MASDVDDLTKFYTSLPSIFQNDLLSTDQHIEDKPLAVSDSEQTYPPVFGSFLFSDSEPLTHAAFVSSSSSTSNERTSVNDETSTMENSLNRIGNQFFPLDTLANNDNKNNDDHHENGDFDDIEEDDFDGIPIRHATNLIKEKVNGDKSLVLDQAEQESFLNQFVRRIQSEDNESIASDNDDDEDAFLKGFEDDQQADIVLRPSIFPDIPDIDDPNEPEEEQNEDLLFDRMDMLDQSESIRSSSADSVLSSSHLRDENEDDDDDDEIDHDEINSFEHHNSNSNINNRMDADDDNENDDDDDDDDDVTQWNDDFLLTRTNIEQNHRPSAPSPSQRFLNFHSHDQVDFIDSSRSVSRCSQASSNFSTGYNDQARIIIDDDGLVTSSETDDDDEDNEHQTHLEDPFFDQPTSNENELSLEINLDLPRSRSLSAISSNSSRSNRSLAHSINDETPIVAMDDEIQDTSKVSPAPIAQLDDEDDEDMERNVMESNDVNNGLFQHNQSLLAESIWNNLRETKRNQLVRDIIDIQHIYQDHQNDDEFLAVMHNPMIFEEVLNDNDDQKTTQQEQIKKSDQLNGSEKTTNSNSIVESFDDSSTLLGQEKRSNGPSSISFSSVIITNNRPVTHVNHLGEREKEEDEEEASVSTSPSTIQSTTGEIQSSSTTKRSVSLEEHIADGQNDDNQRETMSSDDESENDSELLHTLAQIHGLVQSNEKSPHQISIDDQERRFDKKLDLFHYDDHRPVTNDSRRIASQTFSLSSSTSSIQFTDDEWPIHYDNFELKQLSNEIQSTLMKSDRFSSIDDYLFDRKEFVAKKQDDSSENDENQSDLKCYLDWLINHWKANDVLDERSGEINRSSVDKLKPFVEKFIDQSIDLALTDIRCSTEFAERLVDEILIEAIDQVVQSTSLQFTSDDQQLDPFDKKFDQIWSQIFQTPDQQEFEPENFFLVDPQDSLNDSEQCFWLNSNLTTNDSNISTLMTRTFDAKIYHDCSSFSKTKNPFGENEENDSSSESVEKDSNRRSKFEVFASSQPLNQFGIESISAGIDDDFKDNDESQRTDIEQQKPDGDNEPWELEIGEEKNSSSRINEKSIEPIFEEKFVSEEPTFFSTKRMPTLSSSESETDDRIEKENYDDYFKQAEKTENSIENVSAQRTVRFNDQTTEIDLEASKDSLNESSTNSSSSEMEDNKEHNDSFDDETEFSDGFTLTSDRITDHMVNGHSAPSMFPVVPKKIENDDLPPPLPSLPPLDETPNESIPAKKTPTPEIKVTSNPWRESNPGSSMMVMTDVDLKSNPTETVLVRPTESAILQLTSKDTDADDSENQNDAISCIIDNTPLTIDVKTISPFKCVITNGGYLRDDNQTVIIGLYGCWLPDHRLREYRYIMDQLFYYVYHKIESLVTNDYVLVYFHGATPKHRTPDLKFLRKYYQMINFRLRKNLRGVYVVHPTRWLRTVVALSRPFFSNKFYHKVHYIYTISELERQFPENSLSIPVIVEQTDWIYSEKYDRQNASIQRSIQRTAANRTSTTNEESTA